MNQGEKKVHINVLISRRLASRKFYRNFSPLRIVVIAGGGKETEVCAIVSYKERIKCQGSMSFSDQDNDVETRIGTTLLHFALLNGSSLTTLNLGKACCDSVLKVVSETAKNLKYLNISGSVVTDQGLFYICGVEERSKVRRGHLSRK